MKAIVAACLISVFMYMQATAEASEGIFNLCTSSFPDDLSSTDPCKMRVLTKFCQDISKEPNSVHRLDLLGMIGVYINSERDFAVFREYYCNSSQAPMQKKERHKVKDDDFDLVDID